MAREGGLHVADHAGAQPGDSEAVDHAALVLKPACGEVDGLVCGTELEAAREPAARLEISRPSEYRSRQDPFRLRSEMMLRPPKPPSRLKAPASICDTTFCDSVSLVAGAPNGMSGIS